MVRLLDALLEGLPVLLAEEVHLATAVHTEREVVALQVVDVLLARRAPLVLVVVIHG